MTEIYTPMFFFFNLLQILRRPFPNLGWKKKIIIKKRLPVYMYETEQTMALLHLVELCT